MGRQICFFATPVDLEQLFQKIFENDMIVLSQSGKKLDIEDISQLIYSDFEGRSFGKSQFYITRENFNLVYLFCDGVKTINQLHSEVIQFYACRQLPEKILDTSSVDNGFRKGEFIVVHDTTEYQRQIEALRKRPIYMHNPNYIRNGFEHGRFWYTPDYYDETGKKIHKSKQLEDLYKFIGRYVRQTYKLAKDKFGYIAPYAYKNYLDGSFVPCSGKTKIEFE